MDMPRPTDAHRRLVRLAGVWTGEEKMAPSPWDPQGGTAIGRVENRVVLDGFAVVQDYTQKRGGQVTFQGHGVFRWDAGEGCYVLHWWDTMGTPPNVFRGQFEGDTLSMTCQDAQGHFRVTWDFAETGRHSFRMDVSQDGAEWKTSMEGTYARGAGAAAKPKAKASVKARAIKPAAKAKPAKRAASQKPAKKAGKKRGR